ncbi:MAG: sugar phosphate isomerase/epimerase family protein [Bryobacteraceae bacterium]
MRRRDFFIACGVAAHPGGKMRAQTAGKLDRVCVLSWSFRNLFARTRERGVPAPAKDFDILDFPEMIADRYHIHNVEVQSMYFASTERSYLLEFENRLKRAKSRLIDIALEFDDEPGATPTISSPDPKLRQRALELSMQWIDRAAELGSRSVMPNQGDINGSNVRVVIDGLKKLKPHADSRNVSIILENRGTSAGTPEVLARIIKASGIYANPDFGNFSDNQTRNRGLHILFPLADGLCHVRLNPGKFDLGTCMQISREAGFKGLYSIETESNNADPYHAVQAVLDALIQYL